MTAPTTQRIDLDRLRSDLRRYAEIAEVPYDASAVERVIGPLTDQLTSECWVGMRTTTKPVGTRDLNLRLSIGAPVLPLLREAGLLTYQGHPIENLADQLANRFAARVFSIDTSIKGVVDKIWMGSAENIPLSDLLSLPALPPGVRAARAHFDSAGVDKVDLLGLNFTSHTVNLYKPAVPPSTLPAGQIRTLLTDLGFPLPPEEEIQRNSRGYNFYQTFGWDSPDILRLCFGNFYSAAEYPTHYHPLLKAVVEQAPMLNDSVRDFGFFEAYGPRGHYYKISADYTGTHRALYPHHYSREVMLPSVVT